MHPAAHFIEASPLRGKRLLAKYGLGAVPLPEELTCPAVFGFRGVDGCSLHASDDMHIVAEGIGVYAYRGIYDNFDSACGAKVRFSCGVLFACSISSKIYHRL